MKPYKLNGHSYYGTDSELFDHYLRKVPSPRYMQELLKDIKAAIIMDVDSVDLIIWNKRKTTITCNYSDITYTLGKIKRKCIEKEWYEECQVVEDLKEIRVSLFVYDLLKDVFDKEELSKIEDRITTDFDIYFQEYEDD